MNAAARFLVTFLLAVGLFLFQFIAKRANVQTRLSSKAGYYKTQKRFPYEAFERFHVNFTMVSIDIPWRQMRTKGLRVLHNWSYVMQEVESTGHKWCSLVRDNWSCVGQQYKKTLLETPLFNKRFNLNAFPAGSNIYVEGNSHMSELIATIVCNTDNAHVWALKEGGGSSLFVDVYKSNVSLLLISNIWLQYQPQKSLELLRRISFVPNVIMHGNINKVRAEVFRNISNNHKHLYTKEFPDASYVTYEHNAGYGSGSLLPGTCTADFQNCNASGHGHTCIPGPIHIHAENIIRHSLSLLQPNIQLASIQPPGKGSSGKSGKGSKQSHSSSSSDFL